MTMLRGRLAAFDSVSYRADAWLDGSASRLTRGLAVSRAIPAAEMLAGRQLLIEDGRQPDPVNFVVVAAWE